MRLSYRRHRIAVSYIGSAIMAQEQRRKGGKGAGSKSVRNPGAASRKAKRVRSAARCAKRKDRRVAKSSHGKWLTVSALEAHRLKVSR